MKIPNMSLNNEKTRKIRCITCNSNDTRLLYTKNGYNIVKCEGCDLVYVNPRLSNGELDEMYNEDWIPNYYFNTIEEDKKTFKIRLKTIESYNNKKGKLLDVGCGIGTFLKIAMESGWEVCGVELSKISSDYCKNNLNLNVKQGNFNEINFENNSFDVIVMNDFIEHVTNPLNDFKKANNLLQKGGVLYISTPNIDSFVAKISGKNWSHLKPEEHLYYFSKKTISEILKNNGFEIIECKSIGRVRSLNTINKKIKLYNKFLYGLFNLFNKAGVGNLSFNLNLCEEMGIIARKI